MFGGSDIDLLPGNAIKLRSLTYEGILGMAFMECMELHGVAWT